jgi:hypothetical protein
VLGVATFLIGFGVHTRRSTICIAHSGREIGVAAGSGAEKILKRE